MVRTNQSRRVGALEGVAALAVGLGVGELSAAVSRSWWSPLETVADRFIDVVPTWLKDAAIALFATDHRRALTVGMVLVLVAVAAATGTVARRRGRRVVAPVAVGLGVVAVTATATAPGANVVAAIPSALAAVSGAVTLSWLQAPRARGPEVPDTSRRAVLTSGMALAAGAVVVGVGRWGQQRWSATAQRLAVVLPRPRRQRLAVPPDPPVPGITPLITPNRDFFRIDTAFTVPRVDLSSWRLRVTGMVEQPRVWTFDDLMNRPHVEADITLACVSNEVGGQLVGTARWQGVALADLLAEAGVRPEADQIVGRSIDGFTAGFPVGVLDGRDALVALGMNGEPLPARHGFPARLVVPGLYGYVSATKWLTVVELTRFDQVRGYWIDRGWAVEAPVKTQSRIDRPGRELAAGATVIAGVAWAPHVGIEAVEVQVDEGPWQQANLAGDLGMDAWRQWWLAWDATPGRHRVRCRAIDGNGMVQTEQRRPVAPDGATGWHTREVTVNA
jgi:DMSO/TMAO reductase YedYZ molybdopterin-dependent catalytic subunit